MSYGRLPGWRVPRISTGSTGEVRTVDIRHREDSVDAIEFLHNDHEQVLGMLSQLERDAEPVTGDDADYRRRRELVTELVIAESQHEAIEEQYFWPTVRDQV